ncbi:SrtB family sortase [Lysinibacillus sp. 2017]|uniref:class B sortase n=1 Tax=unclassified Lysinibacillus TaxID=2636778 RepID=UPI000D52737F|nr:MULTISPECIES: class B sortase [unclassified Lysinibacillus]AWE06478.1 SrtB family sortase [Lysinibacillus sp. 2017]TGN30592.1 class B sortase [Lysinibacillus sp. S2017]
MRKWIRFASVVVMVICTGVLINYFYSYIKVEKELESAQQIVETSKLETLQQQNKKIIGWLSLEDSRLNNPVLQTDNNEFYLKHNYLNQSSRGGSIFVDYRNDALYDRHTIFYGHVLRNGSMFGELAKFSDQQYATEHPVFIYETNDKTYTLEVFAAYETTTDFYYLETDFTDDTFGQFLTTIQSQSVIEMPVEVSEQDQIVTFSTCTTSADDIERFVVHAKVIPQEPTE